MNVVAPMTSVRTRPPEFSGEAVGRLLSMTGQGRSEVESDVAVLETEIRSVNHRGLKLTVRISDSLSGFEPSIENWLRSRIQRGSVTVQLRWVPKRTDAPVRIDREAILTLARELRKIACEAQLMPQIDVAVLATLPGMLLDADRRSPAITDAQSPAVLELLQRGVDLALERFVQMRRDEGHAMGLAILADLNRIDRSRDRVAARGDGVAQRYRDRLISRIETTLKQHDLQHDRIDVLREVQIFADRSDISEELMRLGAHLERFRQVMMDDPVGRGSSSPSDGNSLISESDRAEAVGRKLDFLIQEMFRESNTIGSKAGDADIAVDVVEIKCALERMRELVQNIE